MILNDLSQLNDLLKTFPQKEPMYVLFKHRNRIMNAAIDIMNYYGIVTYIKYSRQSSSVYYTISNGSKKAIVRISNHRPEKSFYDINVDTHMFFGLGSEFRVTEIAEQNKRIAEFRKKIYRFVNN